MILVWGHYWGLFAAAAAIGVLAGWRAFRPLRIKLIDAPADETGRRRVRLRHRNRMIAAGIAATLALAAAVHGPIGQSDRLAGGIEKDARGVLVHYEMGQVDARLARAPLRRELLMSGPADDFQRKELARMLIHLPGVQSVRWAARTAPSPLRFPLPLLAEIALLALAAFGIGLAAAYMVDLRRRARRDERKL
ncbi:MAG: hypothetical protein ABIP91_09290 [Sphingomicrobium sp.]